MVRITCTSCEYECDMNIYIIVNFDMSLEVNWKDVSKIHFMSIKKILNLSMNFQLYYVLSDEVFEINKLLK